MTQRTQSYLPQDLLPAVESLIGEPIVSAEPVGGGMICRAARLQTAGGPAFVKWRPGGLPRFFACEADGLKRLSATGAIRTPRVLGWRDAVDGLESTPFLLLEWIESAPPRDGRAFAERFGTALATMHRTASPSGGYGLEIENFLGAASQRNPWTGAWPEFYRDHRIVPQYELARGAGLMNPRRERAVAAVIGRLPDILGHDGAPSLVHGDLWSGNFLAAGGGEPVLIDPAVSYSDREVELAFIELFGGFPHGMLDAYALSYPVDDGYEYRRPALQLYPLLVHLNHFGEQYGPAVDDVAAFYLAPSSR